MPATRPTRDGYVAWRTATTRWSDDDVYGHLNNATYYELFDTAVNAYLYEATGLDVRAQPQIGIVAECEGLVGHRGEVLEIGQAHSPGGLLLGVDDVAATKEFYVERGLAVAKSFGRKYVEFQSEPQSVTLALYGRRAAAKDAGVPADGSGSHRLTIGGGIGPCTDPDGFVWTPHSVPARG